MGNFQRQPGIAHEYRRTGTVFAWAIDSIDSSTDAEREWYVKQASTGSALTKNR